MRLFLYLALGLALGACAGGGSPASLGVPEEDDEERPWQEEAVTPPAMVAPKWMPFRVTDLRNYTHLVDTSSISVGKDGVVRYVVRSVSPAGAENVSFEGLRCSRRERKVYAFLRPDATWMPSRTADWRRFTMNANDYVGVLYREFFCPDGVSVRTADEAVTALRRGRHWRALPGV